MSAVTPPLPPRPEPPGEDDCCHSDCPVCVFDLYERALERWQAECERLEGLQR